MYTIKKTKSITNILKNELNFPNLQVSFSEFDNRADINLSSFNCFSALKIAVLISTKAFIKNPDLKFNWIVSDNETKKMLSVLGLKNFKCTLLKECKTNLRKEFAS